MHGNGTALMTRLEAGFDHRNRPCAIDGVARLVLSSPRYAPSNFIEINFQMVDTRSGELIASGSVSDEAWSMQQAAAKAAEKALKPLR